MNFAVIQPQQIHDMNLHPSILMLRVWAVCIFLYVFLPFQLIDRQLSVYGVLIFGLFLMAFCLGTLLIPRPKIKHLAVGPDLVGFRKTDQILTLAAIVAIICFALDLSNKNLFDLANSYELRSAQASALLHGEESSSTLLFQFAFLTYPAGYVIFAREIIFKSKPNNVKLLFLGLLPIVMATLVMGGRAPLLYLISIGIMALPARKGYLGNIKMSLSINKNFPLNFIKILILVILALASFYYFAAVFIVRADAVGGASEMFDIAEKNWGIGFRGVFSSELFKLIGDSFSYLIFVSIWYLIQGFFMANFIFTGYDGPLQMGVYGIDLASALMRRLDGELVARNFNALMELGTYGFLPSAFGSLYVDLSFFGLIICGIWGALAALVYRRIQLNRDHRWLLLAPFINTGIVFSLINTPIGFTNGLITHFWLLLAFFISIDFKAPHHGE